MPTSLGLEVTRRLFPILKPLFALPWNHSEHGVSHWSRVHLNARQLCLAMDIDQAVPTWFSYIHDSMRLDEGDDAGHGPRAAEFAHDLFKRGVIPLTRKQFANLDEALSRHSDGITTGPIEVMVCYDADRLDLGRVDIFPDPKYLCTPVAKDPAFIAMAYARSIGQKQSRHASTEDAGGKPHIASRRPRAF